MILKLKNYQPWQ